VNVLLNKDLIEKDPEKVAKAIIEFKNSMAQRIHTYNGLIFDDVIISSDTVTVTNQPVDITTAEGEDEEAETEEEEAVEGEEEVGEEEEGNAE